MPRKKKQKYVAYYRVSTKKQSAEMRAQKTAVMNYLKKSFPPEKSFTEIESGARTERPQLIQALNYCLDNDATLIVAKLDRLSRDLEFIGWIQNTDIKFVCCDMPQATRETIGFMGVMARWEREQIAKRTKEALAEKRKAGVKLGSHNPRVAKGLKIWRKKMKKRRKAILKEKLKEKKLKKLNKLKNLAEKKALPGKVFLDDQKVIPTIKTLRLQGYSYAEVAKALNKSDMATRGGGKWFTTQVYRVSRRHKL